MVEGRGISQIGPNSLERLKLKLESTMLDLHLAKLSSTAMVIESNGYSQTVPSGLVEFGQLYSRIPSLPVKIKKKKNLYFVCAI